MFQDRIFLGVGGHVVALNVIDGHELWRIKLTGMWSSGFVTGVTLLEGRLYATSNGEITCLDPATGRVHWHNGLAGLGTGFIAVAGSDASGPAATSQTAQATTASTAAMAAAVIVTTTAATS